LAAGVLIVGGARQNSTFIVIGTAMVGTPVVIELASAMVAGSIVVFGYAVSILVHQQSLLVDGSAGDLAALISFLMAIYTANRVAELAVLIVADVNRDAREVTAKQPVPDRILAQEATDGTADDVLGRLSEYNLTPAQRRVAHLAGDGLGQKAIAERLGKSPRTVGNQLREVKNKLAVKTHAELTFRVQQLLALPPQEAHLPPRDP
jgi:DNA-binding CsgD family transcriptional regulator